MDGDDAAAGEIDLTGLDDGFEEYLSISKEEIGTSLVDGVVVLDTNVLLNLYRYDPSATSEFLDVLRRLEGSLFLPHRVAVEFWRNREGVLQARKDQALDVIDRLETLADDAERILNEWRNRSGTSGATEHALQEQISSAVSAATETISKAADQTSHSVDTGSDEVLNSLRSILDGRTGVATSEQQHEQDVQEGLQRAADGVPPGFKDASKSGVGAAGDYLVWVQSLREAERREAAWLTIVTGDDRSDDWFRKVGGRKRGPRLELSREAQRAAGARLQIMTPETLLAHAKRSLNISVSDEAVVDVTAVDNERLPGWTADTVGTFLSRLKAAAPTQYETVCEAAANGGSISRERVYEIGAYDEGRTLRGFTRPATRVSNDMISEGLLSRSSPDPLRTLYLSPDSYVLASGFEIPKEIVRVMQRQDDTAGDDIA